MLLFPAYCVSVTLSKSFLLIYSSLAFSAVMHSHWRGLPRNRSNRQHSVMFFGTVSNYKIVQDWSLKGEKLATIHHKNLHRTDSNIFVLAKMLQPNFSLTQQPGSGQSQKSPRKWRHNRPPPLPSEGLTELYIIISSPRVSTYSRSSGNVITYMIFGSLYRCCLVLLK